MIRFGGIPEEFCQRDTAKILLTPLLYDGTSTWGKGADKAFEPFIEATENMELYDIETDSEVYRNGIFVAPALKNFKSPDEMAEEIYHHTKDLLEEGKFLTFLGGEHSVSIGVLQAFYEKYPDLTIVQLDAHSDLRPSYLGSPNSHACALHKASKNANLIQIGIRSMDIVEKPFLNIEKLFLAKDISGRTDWQEKALSLLTKNVYITVDLDVFDPSIMPATGTPEPGGLLWYEVLNFLREVFKRSRVLGFDIVEFAPNNLYKSPNMYVAQLYYKMLNYKFSTQ